WLGRRLPTAAEWRRIAYGSGKIHYPWGDTSPRLSQVNAKFNGKKPRHLVAAYSKDYSGGATRNGVEHLLGNAEEWTSTLLDTTEPANPVPMGIWNGHTSVLTLAIMGGGWKDGIQHRDDPINPGVPDTGDEETGFRCVETE